MSFSTLPSFATAPPSIPPCPASITIVFSHTGKQTNGILAPYIIKKNKQLILQAKCMCCGKNIEVYNSTIDGAKPKAQEPSIDFLPFVIPKATANKFEVIIKYNYWPENLRSDNQYSNKFENCFIYIIDHGKETKALIDFIIKLNPILQNKPIRILYHFVQFL